MKDIEVGELVLTHKLQFRPVTDIVVKPSAPFHRQVWLRAPGGQWVGATDNHLWWTDKGWLDSNNIRDGEDVGLGCVEVEYIDKTRQGIKNASIEFVLVKSQQLQDALKSVGKSSQSPTQIFFDEMLPPGTPLYDLTVEGDESFVIEGLITHNTNCRCNWVYQPIVEDGEIIGWNCFWNLNPGADHCPTCQDRAAEWAPFVIML